MSLSLKEAETAAHLDPSQENLAVYVKLLEEALEEAGDQSKEVDRLERMLEEAMENADDQIAEVKRLEYELEAAPTREDLDELWDRIQDLERDLDEARAGAAE